MWCMNHSPNLFKYFKWITSVLFLITEKNQKATKPTPAFAGITAEIRTIHSVSIICGNMGQVPMQVRST